MSPRSAALLVGGALAILTAAAPAAPQEIAGTALDPAGQPLAGVPVALHRVGGGSGGTVAAATTDEEGRFRFSVEAVDSAVYFVAMRHDDRMYIGPLARGGVERISDYVVRADPANEAGAVASALSGGGGGPMPPTRATDAARGAPASSAGAVWFVAILALVVAAIFLTTAPGYRRRRKREQLLELARIENRIAAAGPETDTAADRTRREALRQRLAPPA